MSIHEYFYLLKWEIEKLSKIYHVGDPLHNTRFAIKKQLST